MTPQEFIQTSIVSPYKDRDEVSSSGYYLDTLHAAYWAVANTTSFEDAVIQAVNLGNDADTVGAVAGQLAGAIYGYKSIPERWLKVLAWRDELVRLSHQLTFICDICGHKSCNGHIGEGWQ